MYQLLPCSDTKKNQMNLKLFILCLTFFCLTVIESKKLKDYCDQRLCPDPPSKHTACKNKGNFGPNCKSEDIKLLKLTAAQKFLITDIHNYYRSVVSYGTLETFSVIVLRKKLTLGCKILWYFAGKQWVFPTSESNDETGKNVTQIGREKIFPIFNQFQF